MRAQQEHIKKDIIRKAALAPKEIAKYWAEWKTDPPLDEVRLDELGLKANYTKDGATAFLKVYDDTIAYAGLSDSDKVGDANELDNEDGENEDADLPPPPPKPKKESLMEGERELTAGLLSKEAGFRLIVTGKVGEKEIERLIAKLELDKEILAEPDNENDPEE